MKKTSCLLNMRSNLVDNTRADPDSACYPCGTPHLPPPLLCALHVPRLQSRGDSQSVVASLVIGKSQHPFASAVPHLAVFSSGVATRTMAMVGPTSFSKHTNQNTNIETSSEINFLFNKIN